MTVSIRPFRSTCRLQIQTSCLQQYQIFLNELDMQHLQKVRRGLKARYAMGLSLLPHLMITDRSCSCSLAVSMSSSAIGGQSCFASCHAAPNLFAKPSAVHLPGSLLNQHFRLLPMCGCVKKRRPKMHLRPVRCCILIRPRYVQCHKTLKPRFTITFFLVLLSSVCITPWARASAINSSD